MFQSLKEIDQLILENQEALVRLESEKTSLLKNIQNLKQARENWVSSHTAEECSAVAGLLSNDSRAELKIQLFMDLFRGRRDVYPRRFESKRTGKNGYQPSCQNEWIRSLCKKPKIGCNSCNSREFIPVTEDVIRKHLLGYDPDKKSHPDFTIGVYPLLQDETCWFIAADFDEATWKDDAAAYLETCRCHDVPAALERSRSGNGGHIWIFFSEPVPATFARQLGSFMLTETMERRPEIGFGSYDRFFPSQDTMPKGSFGNLIALPLQGAPRKSGNSIFLDSDFNPFPDQWSFLSGIRRMDRLQLEKLVAEANHGNRIVGVRSVLTEEDDDPPWEAPPSRRMKSSDISGPLPKEIELVLDNQIYVSKNNLPPALLNKLIRLAAFQNPEFYKAQAMRLSTFNKPRIISCCEQFPGHLGIPRGCLDEVFQLLTSLNIDVKINDRRFQGNPINAFFQGELTKAQEKAAQDLLEHDTGVLAATTAFGKTVVACYLVGKRNVNTLVLVHRRQLLDQWIARLQEFLGIGKEEIGQIGGGKRSPKGLVDVAIIQSLSKKGTVDDIVGGYGHLIVDECHHVSARSFEIVARQSKAKHVLGLSATVTRKDGHHPIIFMNCGPIRHKVGHRKQAVNRPFEHKVITRSTRFTLPNSLLSKDSIAIQEIYSALILDEDRNQIIIEDVLVASAAGRSPVVLTERKDHLEWLADRISKLARNVIVMSGGMGKKKRRHIEETIAQIPDDDQRIILATGRYLGEGFDDARLDTLFITLPVSWKGTIAQYAGRLHRLHTSKKEVIIYDYADMSVPVLAKMYERRSKGYKLLGYDVGAP